MFGRCVTTRPSRSAASDSLPKLGMANRQGIARSKAHRKILDRLLLAVGMNGVEEAPAPEARWDWLLVKWICDAWIVRRERPSSPRQILECRQELGACLLERQAVVEHRPLPAKSRAKFRRPSVRGRGRASPAQAPPCRNRAPRRARPRRWWISATPRIAARFSGALFSTYSSSACAASSSFIFEQRAPECHASGQITGMDREPGSAGGDRIFVAARPPVLFGELGKRNRRRVLLDPASKFLYAGIVRHGVYSPIATARLSDPVSWWPSSPCCR